MESCFQIWLKSGTDCGLCIAVCPYPNPDTHLHRHVRRLARRNTLARRLILKMDDLFYFRKPWHTRKPAWFAPHDESLPADGK